MRVGTLTPKNKAALAALGFLISITVALFLALPRFNSSSVEFYMNDENARAKTLIVCVFESVDFTSSSDCLNAKEAEDRIRGMFAQSAHQTDGPVRK